VGFAPVAMAGRRCVVTGATDGIGLITAERLAEWGAEVHLVGRNAGKVAATVTRIATAAPTATVRGYVADLSLQADTRRVVAEIAAAAPAIDVLVNNAGAIYTSRALSGDGIELTLALNHLGYFLFTALALPLLRRGTAPRIVNVASEAHRHASLHFDDLQFAHRYTGWGAYGQSKLANIMFTYELARRLAGTGITANTLHPGVVSTRFATNNGFWGQAQRKAMDLFSMTPEQGARTQLHLASSPEVAAVTGQYFDDCAPRRSNDASYRVDDQQRLWSISESLVGETLR
jgi:retinol dehydrogenase-12